MSCEIKFKNLCRRYIVWLHPIINIPENPLGILTWIYWDHVFFVVDCYPISQSITQHNLCSKLSGMAYIMVQIIHEFYFKFDNV